MLLGSKLSEFHTGYRAFSRRVLETLPLAANSPDFIFDIKAHALMTGQGTETKRLPKEIRAALPEELAAKARLLGRLRDGIDLAIRSR